ncbi:MAG TPA: energy transducer TonB [Flavobacterium sp.]|nr:energy transducer TonB [Flavobacterium sp.]
MKKLLITLLFSATAGFAQEAEVVPAAEPSFESVESMASIETRPEYPGGIDKFYKFIATNTIPSENPEFAGGKVFASFVIEKDGTLSDIKILRDNAGFGMADEVIRVLKMSPKWTPGVQNGKPVRVQYSIPVSFADTRPTENPKKSKR